MHTDAPIDDHNSTTHPTEPDSTAGFQQDDLMESQLGVSSFEPHHTTTIVYPECSLLEPSEILCLDPMSACGDTELRYAPLPLIRDEAVTHHADRENEAEVSFFSRTRAQALASEHALPRSNPFASPYERLVQDMDIAERFMGITTLSMLRFRKQGQDGNFGPVMVRVARQTSFRRYGMSPLLVPREEYIFSLAELYPDDCDLPLLKTGWFHYLGVLPLRGGDRAYRHVRLHLAMAGEEDEHAAKHHFKPARRENFGRLLDSKLTAINPADLVGEDKQCCVCSGTLGEEDAQDPVALPCKHVICKSCLVTWVDSRGTDVACPLCRERIFTQQREVDDLRFGLVNGVYEYDERYRDVENFERSCADLDQELAEGKQHRITLHADRLVRILDTLLNGLWLENEDEYQHGSPENFQPMQFPEWATADDVLRHTLFSLDGDVTTPAALFQVLLERVYIGFCFEFCKAGLDQWISPSERKVLETNAVRAECLDIRPGFKEEFRRMVNRMLRFYDLRRCSCSPGLHDHGRRTFYNPKDAGRTYGGADRHRDRIDEDGDFDMDDGCK
ncbi:hypothetical protein LTR36_005658 [Oleoguttula mirabilis]|uniref:RING-type domain-containing protein n=1 Tax=Oleoguttula mirabilis TaxID=1507867 RepID=A0AAV9JE52_9PEZI|nr:hypothetical protein LTR36_005658 [Oleoguttula mirabilis]